MIWNVGRMIMGKGTKVESFAFGEEEAFEKCENKFRWTVWKKSLVLNCYGFTVFDCHGNVAFRVDEYCHRGREMVLMDASGKPLLTLHLSKRRSLGLALRLKACKQWRGLWGDGQETLRMERMWEKSKSSDCYSSRHEVCLLGEHKLRVEGHTSSGSDSGKSSKGRQVYSVVDGEGRVLAHMKRKQVASPGHTAVLLGDDVMTVEALLDLPFHPSLVIALLLALLR